MTRLTPLGRVLISPETVRFLVVGCSNFVVSFTVFRLMLAVPGTFAFKAGVSQLVSYGAGVLWSYYWNRRFTFRASGPVRGQLMRFVILQVSLACSSAVVIDSIVAAGTVGPSIAWLMVMAVATVVNFLGCRLWVFRAERKDAHADS